MEQRWDVEQRARTVLERRLLFREFEQRGRHRAVDMEEHPQGLGLGPTDAGLASFTDAPVSDGITVVDVSVQIKGKVVVGLAVSTRPIRGGKPVFGPVRGLCSKADPKVFAEYFHVEDNDVLCGIEGYFAKERSCIGALRFLLSSGKVSPWFGQLRPPVPDRAQRAQTHSSDSAPAVHSAKLIYFRIGDRDHSDEAIVGLTGTTQGQGGAGTGGKLVSIGAVVRRYTERGIFWRCWLSTRLEDGGQAIDEPADDDIHATRISNTAPALESRPSTRCSRRSSGATFTSEPPKPEATLDAEQQFLQLLRTRAADILTAYHRSRDLARRMRSTAANLPECV